jgi:hypothetical protein
MHFKEKLKSKSKIFLDGGNGSEIAKLGGEMSSAFSALASITSKDIVIKVHEKFIDAGSDLITANTFSSTRHNLESINRGAETKEFIIQSVKLARQAIKNKGKENKIGVAGSLSNFFSLKENEFDKLPATPILFSLPLFFIACLANLTDWIINSLVSAPRLMLSRLCLVELKVFAVIKSEPASINFS